MASACLPVASCRLGSYISVCTRVSYRLLVPAPAAACTLTGLILSEARLRILHVMPDQQALAVQNLSSARILFSMVDGRAGNCLRDKQEHARSCGPDLQGCRQLSSLVSLCRVDNSAELAAEARHNFAAGLAAGEAGMQLAKQALLIAAEDDAIGWS